MTRQEAIERIGLIEAQCDSREPGFIDKTFCYKATRQCVLSVLDHLPDPAFDETRQRFGIAWRVGEVRYCLEWERLFSLAPPAPPIKSHKHIQIITRDHNRIEIARNCKVQAILHLDRPDFKANIDALFGWFLADSHENFPSFTQ